LESGPVPSTNAVYSEAAAVNNRVSGFPTIPVRDEPRIGYNRITMKETWIQLMEHVLARTPAVVNRDGDYFVPGCSYGALDLDENYDPTPERIAAERLTESTYHEVTAQLEVAWGPPDFQGDGARSGLREWQDATHLAYWKKRDDLAIVAVQACDNTRVYILILSARSTAKLARKERAFRRLMAREIALETAEDERAFREVMAQQTGSAPPDPRRVQVVWGGWPQL
jgi:hypothetical protein